MKMGIGFAAWLLSAAFVFSGCASDKPTSSSQDVKQSATSSIEKVQEPSKLLSASENGEVKLFETTDGVIVDVNGSQKKFDWNILKGVFNPQLSYVDLTGDGKEEAVIILVTGHGTELDTNEAHILNGENLAEIKIQRVEEILAGIETEVNQKGDELLIKTKAQGKEYKFSKKVSDLKLVNPDDQFENRLYFGNVILNNVKGQKLTVDIVGSVRPVDGVLPDYVCTVHVTYKYDQALNEFAADQIQITSDQ
ncbi:hypothetical protein M3647_28295 [Paenibacillus cellulositrophicus]|uniref:hypothetical protein n=1 Tax=Paenibacillus cellulositrophicus TaxID=562959 RepID=UPI00203DCB89|nr:hypothetical protein [Paenibacillus cellulositrophicus]MCM3001393.1 hypothetical protein [Paenibacillus cellulositrophicus]